MNSPQSSLDSKMKPFSDTGVSDGAHASPVAELQSRRQILKDIDVRAANETIANKRSVHVGVAGLFNLEIIARSKPDIAILCDNNQNQRKFWDVIVQELKKSETHEDFKRSLLDLCRQDSTGRLTLHAQDGQPLDMRSYLADSLNLRLKATLNHNLSDAQRADSASWEWMNDPEKYNTIRTMALEGRIVSATFDLLNNSACQALKGWINEQQGEISTIYAANIFDMMRPKIKTTPEGIEQHISAQNESVSMDDSSVFSRSRPYRHAQAGITPAPSELHEQSTLLLKNIRELIGQHTSVYLAETSGNLAILDHEWKQTWKPEQWEWKRWVDSCRGTHESGMSSER